MSNELLPCPFCGNELYRSPRNHNPKAYCVTENCYGKRMSVVNLDDPIIVAMWNARAGAAATAGSDDLAAVHKALFEPHESDAIDNLEGALIDIKRLSEQGKPTDQVCIRTLERIQAQLVAAHALVSRPHRAPIAGPIEFDQGMLKRDATLDGSVPTASSPADSTPSRRPPE